MTEDVSRTGSGEDVPRTADPALEGPNLSGRQYGEIVAIGTRPQGGGRIELVEPPVPGEPTMRWLSHAHSIDEIETELNRIWSQPNLLVEHEGERPGRHIAARTSVMNLVVIARQPETGERAAETIQRLTGRHPSRTLVVMSADPDGPSWLEARIQAHCVLPREDAPETCTELIFLTAGGETGRHLTALVEPLLVHDLPVTVWWPGEPPLDREPARDLLEVTDRLVVDGSSWAGDGLRRLHQLARLYDDFERLAIRDFALVRQSRWREAIACVFDLPELLPYLGSLRRIAVAYGTHDDTGVPGSTNIVKPLYHVAWLASRLGLRVVAPLAPVEAKRVGPKPRPGEKPPMHRGLAARLRGSAGEVAVVMRPIATPMPAGTTLRIELLAERRGAELRVDVTAEAENVHVHTWLDGVQAVDRVFKAPRRGDVDLLGEALETGGRDPLAVETIRKAAELIGEAVGNGHRE
ncbi:MAG TPA: glucose-6-phosphate dehydrogenase assembly protein OpcA [Candidatus Limnocylindrales bacterium]|nr:glucose-6-phosphate dehydrogenase assembly protein OpcA [Candidatus Limnocylindrales bacterium]